MVAEDRQRIDKWLWFARVVKTRALAQELAQSGKVRLNGRKVDAASQAVKRGDVLTIGLHGRVLVLEVLAFAERRGSFPQAQQLYQDRSEKPLEPEGEEADENGPEAAAAAAQGVPRPVRGEGRPTKRARRALDRFTPD